MFEKTPALLLTLQNETIRKFSGIDDPMLLGTELFCAALENLPLDAHGEVGNNAVLCRMIGLQNCVPCCEYAGNEIGFAGELPMKLFPAEVAAVYEKSLPCGRKIGLPS